MLEGLWEEATLKGQVVGQVSARGDANVDTQRVGAIGEHGDRSVTILGTEGRAIPWESGNGLLNLDPQDFVCSCS